MLSALSALSAGTCGVASPEMGSLLSLIQQSPPGGMSFAPRRAREVAKACDVLTTLATTNGSCLTQSY